MKEFSFVVMMRLALSIFLVGVSVLLGGAQQTVGLFTNESGSFDGYTLVTPMVSKKSYLIDNCGYVVNQWESLYRPGLSAYLLEDGDLLRTGYLFSSFNSGGTGGRVERFSWEGELEWGFDYSSAFFHQHHDIEPLPNGNVLLIAWESITRDTAIAAGRDTNTVSDFGLWPDHIVEVEPVGSNGGQIVWEWHVMDHLVQDYDSTKANFGVVKDHPELIDFNRSTVNGFPSGADWNHCNGIDYLPEEDLIVLSSRNFSELWVIDHSTTPEESAGHSGGRFGRGGDLLYRWGNPASYGRGNESDRIFYGQHDPSWQMSEDGELSILVYNNGVLRPEGRFSSVDEFILPELTDSGFVIREGIAFGPDNLAWTYDGSSEEDQFYSSSISGAHRQPNGNTLICVGGSGRIIEIDSNENVVWEYVNPDAGSPITQGDPAGANNVFKVFRYSHEYPAFDGRELVAGERIELEPYIDDCTLNPSDTTTALETVLGTLDIRMIQNPVGQTVSLVSEYTEGLDVSLVDFQGRLRKAWQMPPGVNSWYVDDLASGSYLLTFRTSTGRLLGSLKLLKQ